MIPVNARTFGDILGFLPVLDAAGISLK